MSFGMDWSWLSNLFASNPSAAASFIQPGQDPSMWQAQMTPPPPMMSPEMGGGAGRQIDLATVDALGPGGRNVNAASSVAAGGQPTFGDKLADMFGIDAPGGMAKSDGGKALQALMKLAPLMAQQGRRKPPGLLAPEDPMPPGGLLSLRYPTLQKGRPG